MDNTTDAFTLKQGSNEYITVDTNNSSELITLGNTTTNPKTVILGGNCGVGTTSPTDPVHLVASTADVLRVESTSAGDTGANILLYHNSASPADNDIVGVLNFRGNDSGGNQTTYAEIRSSAADVTNGTEDGILSFHNRIAGSFGERMRLDHFGNMLIGKNVTAFTTDGVRIDGTGLITVSRTSTSTVQGTANGASLSLCNPSATDNNFSNVGFYKADGLVTSQINGITTSQSSRHGALSFLVHNGSSLAEKARITKDGRVGIGTTAPTEILTIGDGDLKFFHSNAGTAHRTTFIEFGNSSNRITSEQNYGSDSSSNYTAGLKFTTKNFNGSSFATVDALNIQANGRVGIGTTSPSQKLTVAYSNGSPWSTSSLGVGMKVENTNAVNGVASGIELRSFQNNGGASIQYIHAVNDGVSSYGSDLVFSTRVAYTGAYRESCRITNAGNLKFPNGHGIDFSATSDGTNATSVSETLDDYEEGTFIVTLANSLAATGTQKKLTYTKIGNKVHISGQFQVTTGGSDLIVNNLPFATKSTGGTDETFSTSIVKTTNVTKPTDGGASGEIMAIVLKNDTNMTFVYTRTGNDPNAHTATTNGYYTVSLWYTT